MRHHSGSSQENNVTATNETQFSTSFLLFAQYGGKAVIPVEDVCRDYFNHLTPDKFLRKVGTGEIAIPVVRAETSQKCQKGIYLQDLAEYLDQRREAALKEFRQLHR
ncbi:MULTISPECIES: pyocin activator PrtN family protein [Rhizobium]|uniref:pyocin activator PrtN family protein n=1 Tax=Rhizobium TaxID=379 RepID=UPI00103E73F9|nr:pyocin activator PrtN family protein [Rhizobium leguminosarum]TBZ99715.1 Pyocin activator protein PrtN [Rhizobium leguminosarum bv. viciae]UFW80736.1 pyocin activator PrtN family protein [Rhizobium leguminosarum bv. viciae]